MPAQGTDNLIVDRAGTLYKAPAQEVGVLGTRFVAQTIGDGALTTLRVTHNFGTRRVAVQMWRNSAPFDEKKPQVLRTTVNDIDLVFDTAPAVDEWDVMVIG